MPKNRLLASLAVTAGLLAGGATAIIFGPTASGAQTSTTEAPPTTAAPAPGGTTTPAPGTARPHDGNCPHMGGSGTQGSGTSGTSGTPGTSAGGSGAATQQLSFRRV